MKECKYCHEPQTLPLLHLAECPLAPDEGRALAQQALEKSEAYKKKLSCCTMRKKVLLRPLLLPEEYCGISDSNGDLLDHMTFEKFEGMDVVLPRFCPWCGKEWR